MRTIPVGAAVRENISGWPGQVVARAPKQPRGTLNVLLDGTSKSVFVDVVNLTYVAKNYASAKDWENQSVELAEPLSIGGSAHV